MLPRYSVSKTLNSKPTDALPDCPPLQVIYSKNNEPEHKNITLYLKYTERITQTSPNSVGETIVNCV